MPALGGYRPGDAPGFLRGGRAAARAILAVMCAATLAAAISGKASATSDTTPGLFHSVEKRSSKISIFTKWSDMIGRYARDRRVSAARCEIEGGSWCTIGRWHAFLATLRGLSRLEQLQAVNSYMNRMRYITDANNYGTIDYWATPREFFTRGGDCEDYAIAKLMSLRELGWSTGQLRIAVVMDRRKRQAHAVLVAYHQGNAYILDNQTGQVLRDDMVRHYHPVYSINERYWWFHMAVQPATN